MKRSVAIACPVRDRYSRRPANAAQRRTLAYLSRTAGMEEPRVYWSHQASDAIDRLEQMVREPTLGPMG